MLDSRKEWENIKSQKDYNATSICIKLRLLTQAYAICKTRMFKHIAEQGRYIPLNRTLSSCSTKSRKTVKQPLNIGPQAADSSSIHHFCNTQ
jgi:hypothetical protein